jgi:hypothetical protein
MLKEDTRPSNRDLIPLTTRKRTVGKVLQERARTTRRVKQTGWQCVVGCLALLSDEAICCSTG